MVSTKPNVKYSQESSENFLGGAGIVASHFKSFCKNVSYNNAAKDTYGKFAIKNLEKNKIQVNSFVKMEDLH